MDRKIVVNQNLKIAVPREDLCLALKKMFTTHAGSRPRPRPLTQLYADRVADLKIDESMLSDRSYHATKWVIEQQKAVGIDFPNK